MNDAKKIYVEQNAAVSVRAVPALEAESKVAKKSILEKIADYLIGSDLDLATFERIEGVSNTSERESAEQCRHMGRRL